MKNFKEFMREAALAPAPVKTPTKTPVKSPDPAKTPDPGPNRDPWKFPDNVPNPGPKDVLYRKVIESFFNYFAPAKEEKPKSFFGTIISSLQEAIEIPAHIGDMHDDIKQKYTHHAHPLGDEHVDKFYPEADKETGKHLIEKNAEKRFTDLVEKIRKYTGISFQIKPDISTALQLANLTTKVLNEIATIEKNNTKKLEDLAIKLTKELHSIPEGRVQFKAIIDPELTKTIQTGGGQEEEKEVNIPEEDLNFELFKRHFINAITQGSALAADEAYHLVSDELAKINPKLLNLYGAVMPLIHIAYWITHGQGDAVSTMDAEEEMEMQIPSAGQVQINAKLSPPLVYAEARNFVILLHELSKGVYELFALHGLPKDKGMAEKVLKDTQGKEEDSLRLGREFQTMLRKPLLDATRHMKLTQEEINNIIARTIMIIYQMPARDFHSAVSVISHGGIKAERFMKKIVDQIQDEKRIAKLDAEEKEEWKPAEE